MKHLERIVVVLAVVMQAGTLVLGTTRPSAPPTTATSLRMSPAPELASLPAQGAGTASRTASQSPAAGRVRHPRPEELVVVPQQIQNQVRHAQQAPTTENRISRRQPGTVPSGCAGTQRETSVRRTGGQLPRAGARDTTRRAAFVVVIIA